MPTFRVDDLNAHLASIEHSLLDMNGNTESLTTQYNETVELRCVLERAAEFFRSAPQIQYPSLPNSATTKDPGSGIIPDVMNKISALSDTPPIVVDDYADASPSAFGARIGIHQTERSQSSLLSFFTDTITKIQHFRI